MYYESVVFMFFYIFIMIVCLGALIPKYEKFAKATGSVVNYDRYMTKFVYKVYMPKEEIISSLKIMNVKDELSCTFDFEKTTVLITDIGQWGSLGPGPRREYFYEIQECDGFSILKLSAVSPRPNGRNDRTDIPLRLNPFMVSKINAEIVPFSQYGK